MATLLSTSFASEPLRESCLSRTEVPCTTSQDRRALSPFPTLVQPQQRPTNSTGTSSTPVDLQVCAKLTSGTCAGPLDPCGTIRAFWPQPALSLLAQHTYMSGLAAPPHPWPLAHGLHTSLTLPGMPAPSISQHALGPLNAPAAQHAMHAGMQHLPPSLSHANGASAWPLRSSTPTAPPAPQSVGFHITPTQGAAFLQQSEPPAHHLSQPPSSTAALPFPHAPSASSGGMQPVNLHGSSTHATETVQQPSPPPTQQAAQPQPMPGPMLLGQQTPHAGLPPLLPSVQHYAGAFGHDPPRALLPLRTPHEDASHRKGAVCGEGGLTTVECGGASVDIDLAALQRSYTSPVPLHHRASDHGLHVWMLWQGTVHTGSVARDITEGSNCGGLQATSAIRHDHAGSNGVHSAQTRVNVDGGVDGYVDGNVQQQQQSEMRHASSAPVVQQHLPQPSSQLERSMITGGPDSTTSMHALGFQVPPFPAVSGLSGSLYSGYPSISNMYSALACHGVSSAQAPEAAATAAATAAAAAAAAGTTSDNGVTSAMPPPPKFPTVHGPMQPLHSAIYSEADTLKRRRIEDGRLLGGDSSAGLEGSEFAPPVRGEYFLDRYLGGTTGHASREGRCAVCLVQRKGRCGTKSAPGTCLRVQAYQSKGLVVPEAPPKIIRRKDGEPIITAHAPTASAL